MKKLFTLFVVACLTSPAFAQLPNWSFESWTAGGSGAYDDPDSWGTPNATIHSLIPGTYTCEKGTTGAPVGTSYIKLTSKTVATIVAPGMAVSGILNVTISPPSFNVSGGFPYATRPQNLSGKWQHMGSGADHGRVVVYLTKWNATTNMQDTVAKADSTLTGMAMAWEHFDVKLTYLSGATPDTGLIVLSSSSDPAAPVAGSYLYVDSLGLTGTVPSGVISVVTPNAASTIFPNPASSSAVVYYHSSTAKGITINLTDLNGRVVKSMSPKAVSGENNFSLDLHGVAQGVYMVQVVDETGTAVQKLIVE